MKSSDYPQIYTDWENPNAIYVPNDRVAYKIQWKKHTVPLQVKTVRIIRGIDSIEKLISEHTNYIKLKNLQPEEITKFNEIVKYWIDL